MKLNDICKKLVNSSKDKYKVILICLIFAISLFTSMGLIVFSPMVKNGIVEGGTTSGIAYLTYMVTGIGCLMFTMYSHSLFMKYKSSEIGIFISLGLQRKNIKKILLKELTYILPLGSVFGIILGVPLAYIFWSLMTYLIGIKDIPFTISINGIVGSLVFCFILISLIKWKTARYIKKVDIITIIKNEETIEKVKGGNYIIGIIGVITLVLSLVLYKLSAYGIIFRGLAVESIFAVTTIISVYIIASQACAFGSLAKKINIKNYYKNIMFYNLLKLKGKQYANTLFAVIILIGITVFTMCFSLVPATSAEQIIERSYPFDYVVRRTTTQNNNVEKEDIYNLATENNIKISEYNEIELLKLVRGQQFANEIFDTEAICLSEDTYNKVYKENIDVESGYYNRYADDKSLLKTDTSYKLWNIGKNVEKEMKMQEGVHKKLIQGDISTIGDFFVLDNDDYNKFIENSPKEAVESHITFNVDDWKNTMDFYKALRNTVITSNKDGINMGYGLLELDNSDIETISYTEMDIQEYNSWKYKPYAKISGFTDDRNENIYFLLFAYLGILSVVAAASILCIKVLNISWQDKKIYSNISILGANKNFIKSIITKQLMIIFFVPTIVGVSLGIYLSNMMNSQTLYADIYLKYAILFGGIFCIAQIFMFILTKLIVIKKYINTSN